MNKIQHEVYLVKVKNSIVYIGSGKRNRHRHCISGVSHVYGLNALHFTSPNQVTVHVIQDSLTQERSLELELELIKEYRPIYNKRDNESFNNKFVPIQYIDEVTKKNRSK